MAQLMCQSIRQAFAVRRFAWLLVPIVVITPIFALASAFATAEQCLATFSRAERPPRTEPQPKIDRSRTQTSPQRVVDLLRDKLIAVHGTSVMPIDGIMIAGARKTAESESVPGTENMPPSFRPTLHFSLGELVRPHGRHSWEEKPFAILLPLRSIEKQIVNINPYDSFLVGDLKLPPEAVIVVPEKDAHLLPSGFKTVTYDPATTNLRQAVDEGIRSMGGWKIAMEETAKSGRRANLGGRNINTREFFAPMLREIPQLSYGNHLYSEVGEIGRMGMIEQAVMIAMSPSTRFGFSQGTIELRFLENFIRHHLERLDKNMATLNLSDASIRTYRSKREYVLGWLNILEMERRLNVEHGLTLTHNPEDIFPSSTMPKAIESVSRPRLSV